MHRQMLTYRKNFGCTAPPDLQIACRNDMVDGLKLRVNFEGKESHFW